MQSENRLLKFPQVVMVAFLLAITQLLLACPSSEKKEEQKLTVPDSDVIRVMNKHADSLMAIPGVTGVSVSALPDGSPTIMILIIEESATLRESLPDSLDGYPVVVNVSGEIRPLDGN